MLFSTNPSSRMLDERDCYLYTDKYVYEYNRAYRTAVCMRVCFCTQETVCVHIPSVTAPSLYSSRLHLTQCLAFQCRPLVRLADRRSKDCRFSLMSCNLQIHVESKEQVKNPWHSEEFLPGFENRKPPPSFCLAPGSGENPRSGLHHLEKAKQPPSVQKPRKESSLGLTGHRI